MELSELTKIVMIGMLIIAVPAVLLLNHFNRRMNVMLTIAENHTRSLRTSLQEIQASQAVDLAGEWLNVKPEKRQNETTDAVEKEPAGTLV